MRHGAIVMVRPPARPTLTAGLPPFTGLGRSQVVVPETPHQFEAAVAALLAAGVAGFDTESKPTFKVGEVSDGPHIVQFSLAGQAFIFQLHHPACVPALRVLLQAPGLVKAGFGLDSDRAFIQAKLGFRAEGVLDLNASFVQRGYRRDVGVRGAVALCFGQRFAKSKSITTTNWAQRQLSDPQLLYAANDAYAALRVWQVLQATPAGASLPFAPQPGAAAAPGNRPPRPSPRPGRDIPPR